MIGTTGNGGDDGTLLLAMRPALPYRSWQWRRKASEGVFSKATLQLRISCPRKKDCVQKEAVRCEEVEGEIMSKREEGEEEGYGKKEVE